MAFIIGTQSAGVITNAEGDPTIDELQVNASWSPMQVRAELAQLQRELAGLDLPRQDETAVRRQLEAALLDVRPGGNPRRVADRLASLTKLLADAGALSSARFELVNVLRRAGAALGPAGAAVLVLL